MVGAAELPVKNGGGKRKTKEIQIVIIRLATHLDWLDEQRLQVEAAAFRPR